MDPFDLLMTEHRLIEQVLDSLAGCAGELSAGAAVERTDLAPFVEFVRDFADAGHHAKEEDVLFEVMVRSGFPAGGGPVAVMLAEHDQGRAITAVVAETAEATGPFADGDAPRLLDAATALQAHLRQHIVKEDQVLYPMARMHLPPPALAEVAERVAEFQERWEASGEAGRLRGLGEGLVRRWGCQ